MIYNWLRKKATYATFRTGEQTSQSRSDLNKHRHRKDEGLILSPTHRIGSSSNAFANRGEYYILEMDLPEAPAQIHVRHDFTVTSQDMAA